MPSYEHTKLAECITSLDTLPEDSSEYANWIKAAGHLSLLRDNAKEDELIVFAMDKRTLIHAVAISEGSLQNVDRNVLLHWSGNPFSPCASYEYDSEGGSGIDRDSSLWHHELLSDARRLVFGRELEGSKDGSYYEISQEYIHLTGIHWRPERHAYCCFDELGDWEDVVSVTQDKGISRLDLLTFKRPQLEQFLIASNSALVRMFEFILQPLRDSIDWTAEIETVSEDTGLFYHQRIEAGKAGYYRGVQIIRPPRSPSGSLSQSGFERARRKKSEYAEFAAWDWRHGRITNISTDPSATTNHQVPENDLPFALSPAFFRPEVLSKYKNDPDKYTIDEEHRSISCRGSWDLRSYGVNEVGQVHAYICDLQLLPYKEQQYWHSFNEEPKTGISQRALANDFNGTFSDTTTPLEDLRSIVRRWSETNVQWWQPHERDLDKDIHAPNNRSEWAQSFLDLAKLVIEGFDGGDIFYNILKKAGKEKKKDKGKGILLMEKVLAHQGILAADAKLNGLRTIQLIRSKCGAHPRGSEAIALEKKAEEEYGSFSAHFEYVCKKTVADLGMIESIFL